MVVLKGSVPMAFGGTQEPAAYGELVSIGGLNPDVNKKLSAGIASILESKLSIPKSRFYLKFHDSKAHPAQEHAQSLGLRLERLDLLDLWASALVKDMCVVSWHAPLPVKD
ncbi:hypothetical protein U9M48_005548, partial [Paspalum notatum var. saurae]